MAKSKESLSFKNKGRTVVYSTGMTTERALEILKGRRSKVEDEMAIYEYFYKKYLQLKKKKEDITVWICYLSTRPDFFSNDKYNVNNGESENK